MRISKEDYKELESFGYLGKFDTIEYLTERILPQFSGNDYKEFSDLIDILTKWAGERYMYDIYNKREYTDDEIDIELDKARQKVLNFLGVKDNGVI